MNLLINEKNRIKNILNNKEIKYIPRTRNSDVLLVDSMNTFIRAFSAIPSLNENGLHIGGISGFLKSIGAAIKTLKPTRVICVFDGEGGSLNRRKIYKDYKSGRRSRIKFNRTYTEMISMEDENNNMKFEFARIIDYLKKLPVTIISAPNVEADDVIAYLALDYFKNSNVNIMSTDKDFLQLINEKIKVWSPVKKILYGEEELFEEYGITSNNFIFYRILNGDESDNIPGINGAGLKTIKKAFPFLSDKKTSSIQEIINYSENNISRYKIYEKIIENKDLLDRNYKLMQLKDSIIRPFTQLKLKQILEKNINPLSEFEFGMLIVEDRMNSIFSDYQKWIADTWATINFYN